jgi:hypothetical protein
MISLAVIDGRAVVRCAAAVDFGAIFFILLLVSLADQTTYVN